MVHGGGGFYRTLLGLATGGGERGVKVVGGGALQTGYPRHPRG